MRDNEKLQHEIERQSQRLDKARRERHTLLAATVHIGVLGLSLVLPMIAGAYVGRWLDERLQGYSMRWTLSLLLLGTALGAYNIYRSIRE